MRHGGSGNGKGIFFRLFLERGKLGEERWGGVIVPARAKSLNYVVAA